MTASTMQSFRSTVARTCQSPWECPGIQVATDEGATGAMVPQGEGLPPAMFCTQCVKRYLAESQPGPVIPEAIQLCNCANTEDGFSVKADGSTVHAWCGLPRALPQPAAVGLTPMVQDNIRVTSESGVTMSAPDSFLPPQIDGLQAEAAVVRKMTGHRVLTAEEQEDAGIGAAETMAMLAITPEQATPAPGVQSNMDQLRAQDAIRHTKRITKLMNDHGVDEERAQQLANLEDVAEAVVVADRDGTPMPAGVIACGPPEATKRTRGRPPKVAGPLVVEKRDGDLKWCVVYKPTDSVLLTAIPSKAKAIPYVGKLGSWGVDWPGVCAAVAQYGSVAAMSESLQRLLQNEQLHVYGSPLYQEGLADELTRATSDVPTGDAPGQERGGAGAAAGAVGTPEGSIGPGGQGSEGPGAADQAAPGGVGEPGPGPAAASSDHDQPGTDPGGTALQPPPAAEVGPRGPGAGLPGDSGGVQPDGTGLVPGPALTDGPPMVVDASGLHHGPGADCAECEADGRWCAVAEDVLWRAAYNAEPQHLCIPDAGSCQHPECVKARTDGTATTPVPAGPRPDPTPVHTPVTGPLWAGLPGADLGPDPAGAGPAATGDPAHLGSSAPGGSGHVSGPAVGQPAPTPGPQAGPGLPPSTGARTAPGPVGTLVPVRSDVSVVPINQPSVVGFMANARHITLSGNTPWASRYAEELREIVKHHANNDPRSLQTTLGPSEIGHRCHRQVVGKLAGIPATNHVTDVWPSWMGRAGHKAMEDVFGAENARIGWERWFTERRVTPHPNHPGTSDLYDNAHFCVGDHKFLGDTQMNKVRSGGGPPVHYQFQLKLYALGYIKLGYRVDRIAILCWPRTRSTIEDLYVWEHILEPNDMVLLNELFTVMEWREQAAAAIRAGQATLNDIPHTPDAEDCYFCPFYRPRVAQEGGIGCPGHVGT